MFRILNLSLNNINLILFEILGQCLNFRFQEHCGWKTVNLGTMPESYILVGEWKASDE